MPGMIWFLALLTWPAPPQRQGVQLRVPAWLEGSNGAAATKELAHLQASINGAPARVARVLGPQDEMLLVLVLDLTEDLSLAGLAKETLIAEIGNLPPQVYVALLRAQEGLRVLVDPTSERAPVIEAIRQLPVSGKAGLLESLAVALRLTDAVAAKAAVRSGVLFVTDSSIYNYREDYINPVINYSDHHDLSRRFPEGLIKDKISRLERQLAAFQAPLFVVHLNYRSDRLNEAYQTGLMQLASLLGGTSQFCRSRQEISEAVSTALRRLVSLYRVDVEVTARVGKTVGVQLETKSGTLAYRNRFALEER